MAKPFTKLFYFSRTTERKLFKSIVGKEENAGHQQFLILPHCFLPSHKQISSYLKHLIRRSANAFKW